MAGKECGPKWGLPTVTLKQRLGKIVMAASVVAMTSVTFDMAAMAQSPDGRWHKPAGRGHPAPLVVKPPMPVVTPQVARRAPPQPHIVPQVARRPHNPAVTPYRYAVPPHRPPPYIVPHAARHPHGPAATPYRYATPAHRPPPVRHEGGRRRHWGWAPGVAIGAGALIIGSAAYAEHRQSVFDKCAARFESFDWEDGTIVNEDGERELCPYLD